MSDPPSKILFFFLLLLPKTSFRIRVLSFFFSYYIHNRVLSFSGSLVVSFIEKSTVGIYSNVKILASMIYMLRSELRKKNAAAVQKK